jgi:hypothetical protein
MNDDASVPARDAEGRTSFYAEKTAQSLYAQLGLTRVVPRSGPGLGPASAAARDGVGIDPFEPEPGTPVSWSRLPGPVTACTDSAHHQTQIIKFAGAQPLWAFRPGAS